MKGMKVKTTVESDKTSFFLNSANYTCRCLFTSFCACFISICVGFMVGAVFDSSGQVFLPSGGQSKGSQSAGSFTLDLEAMQETALELQQYLENYYKSEKSSIHEMLTSGLGIPYGSEAYAETISYISKNMKYKLSSQDPSIRFKVGVIGSSVAAAHDNCNFDGYERQMERLMYPVFAQATTEQSSIEFQVLNTGEGGGCGDSHENQVFCVRQAVGDDVDIVHYSWTYFEGPDKGFLQHEQIVRWALMLEHSPALQIFNAGGKKNQCLTDKRNSNLFDKYGKYGFNALCLESALYANGFYKGKVWEEVGDGLHDITRYGDYQEKENCKRELFQGCDADEIPLDKHRRESLGVTWRNWHPGPLGFQTTADLFVFQYLEALVMAIEELLISGPVQEKDRELLFIDDLGEPLYCSPEECNLEEPPGCLNLEKPAYGFHQIKIVDADDYLSPYLGETPKPLQVTGAEVNANGWKLRDFPGKILVPKSEKRFETCEHLDVCGAVTGQKVADSWLVFQLPKMSIGRIIICGCCGKKVGEEMFINNDALEVQFQKKVLDPATFEIYPNEKCVQVMKKFPDAVEDSTGHLYLALRMTKDAREASKEVKVSHVIAF